MSPLAARASISIVDRATGAAVFKVDVADVLQESELTVVLRDNWLLYTYRPTTDSSGSTRVVSLELFFGAKTSEYANAVK